MSDEEYYWEKAEFQDPYSHRQHVDNYKKGIRDSVAFDDQYAKEAEAELEKERQMKKFIVIEDVNNDFMSCIGIYDDYHEALSNAMIYFTEDMDSHNADKATITKIDVMEGDTGYMFSWEYDNYKTTIYILIYDVGV